MSDHATLTAEKSFLEARLAELPADARLTRHSTESRLRAVTEALARTVSDVSPRAAVKLTFRGRPVLGSEGIFADFAMKAVGSFSEAVAAVAASLSAPLAAMGPIPNRDLNRLLITGTALGSFGFELKELPQQVSDWTDEATVARALKQTQDLLLGTTSADDELLADAAAEIDQRAIDKVRAFVSVLADNEAVCTLQNGDRVFRFAELGQVQAALARLSSDNLQEVVIVVEGVFEGLLPKRRTFEFRRSDTGDVVTGKVSAAIDRPEAVNDHLGEPVTVQLAQTVVGRGRPRYVLQTLPEWPA